MLTVAAAVAVAVPAPALVMAAPATAAAPAPAAAMKVSELRGTTVPFNGMQLAVTKNMMESLKVTTPPTYKPPPQTDRRAHRLLVPEPFFPLDLAIRWSSLINIMIEDK